MKILAAVVLTILLVLVAIVLVVRAGGPIRGGSDYPLPKTKKNRAGDMLIVTVPPSEVPDSIVKKQARAELSALLEGLAASPEGRYIDVANDYAVVVIKRKRGKVEKVQRNLFAIKTAGALLRAGACDAYIKGFDSGDTFVRSEFAGVVDEDELKREIEELAAQMEPPFTSDWFVSVASDVGSWPRGLLESRAEELKSILGNG